MKDAKCATGVKVYFLLHPGLFSIKNRLVIKKKNIKDPLFS